MSRIEAVLRQLSKQRVPREVAWEILLIDNASTDGTGTVTTDLWRHLGAPAPMRVVLEPNIGLSNARIRALKEALFETITLVDDDNLICSDWVATCAEVMRSEPSVGAVGGRSRLPVDARPPQWFSKLGYLYAVKDFGPEGGDVTETRPLLWGAGLTVRTRAWSSLYEIGFRPMLSDRKGTALGSGGDSELCLALRRAGWRLRYEPRLQFEHAIPAARFEWTYFRRLARGSGRATPALDAFYPAYQAPPGCRRSLRRWWGYQALRAVFQGLKQGPAFLFPGLLREGDPAVATLEALRGRLSELLTLRREYGRRFSELDACRWGVSGALAEKDARAESPD